MWINPKTRVTTIQTTGNVSSRRRTMKASIVIEYSVQGAPGHNYGRGANDNGQWSFVILRGGKEPLTGLLRGFKKGKIELNDLSLLEQHAYQTQTSHKFNELDPHSLSFYL